MAIFYLCLLETMVKVPGHEEQKKTDHFHQAQITPGFLKNVIVSFISLKCTNQFPKNICYITHAEGMEENRLPKKKLREPG